MERSTLHSNNLGSSRNLGLTASPDREHSPTQGRTASGMGVEQVQDKTSTETLKGLIAQAGDFKDKARLKDFLIQYLPTGKHFNLVYGQLKNSKNFNVRDIATLYADNKEAADTAYESIVRDEGLDDCLRKNAADAISSEDQQQNAYCHLLKTCEPSNSQMLTDLLMIIGDKNKQKQVCYDILQRVLGHEHALSEIIYPINQEPDFEDALTQIIKNNINKTYIAIDCCLQYIKSPEIKQDVQALASNYSKEQEKFKVEFEMQKTILEIKQPAATADGFRKKLTSIQNLATMPIAEKDDLYLHVIKVASLKSFNKLQSVNNHILNVEKKDAAYVYLAKSIKESLYFRPIYIENIKNKGVQQKVLEEIITDPREDIHFRILLCSKIDDKGQRNNQFRLLANDESLHFSHREKAALKLETSRAKDEIVLKLIGLLKEDEFHMHVPLIAALSDEALDFKNKLLLPCVEASITALNAYSMNNPVDAQVLGLDLGEAVTTIINFFLSINNPHIIHSLAKKVIQYPFINSQEAFYQGLLRNRILDLVLNAMNTSIAGLAGGELSVAQEMKLAAAGALLDDSSCRNINMDEELIQVVRELYHTDNHIDGVYFVNKVFNTLKNPDNIKILAEELVQNPRINSQTMFYEKLLDHKFLALVVKTMNTSIEGLEGEPLEGVKKMKLAAARALLNLDNDNMDALTTILALEAKGGDSPYALYARVLEQSKESVALEDVLAKKQEQLASLMRNGQKVCLSAGAYALPAVMNAEWQEGFETIDFAYFKRVIQSLCQAYREAKEMAISQTDDIADIERLKKDITKNETLEAEYLDYFNEDGRSVLKTALNTKNATASHGNKMKAIAIHIDKLKQEDKIADALSIVSDLMENMQTCKGGDHQEIETAYMHIRLSESPAMQADEKALTVEEAALKKETQKVLNSLYKIRLNWVLENTNELRNGKQCVQYSPEAADGSFPEKLNTVLSHPCLNDKRVFGNTHIGLAIVGIAGQELGLRAQSSHASFDVNCAVVKNFIADAKTTKANILEAFTDAFTFENTWKAIGQELWSSLATASELPLKKEELFKTEDCTQEADLGTLNTQDPMSSGVLAFLGSIHEAKQALANAAQGSDSKHEYIQLTLKQDILKLMDKKEYYYKDKDSTVNEVYDITLCTGFSKEALARVLQELGLLTVLP